MDSITALAASSSVMMRSNASMRSPPFGWGRCLFLAVGYDLNDGHGGRDEGNCDAENCFYFHGNTSFLSRNAMGAVR